MPERCLVWRSCRDARARRRKRDLRIASLRSPLIRSRWSFSTGLGSRPCASRCSTKRSRRCNERSNCGQRTPHICWPWESRGCAKPISSKLKNFSGAYFKSSREMHRASYTWATFCSTKRSLTKLDCGWRRARARRRHPEVFYYLGLVAQEQNDPARAITLFEKAVKLPTYVHARVALGSSYMRLKDYTRARQELETAVKLDLMSPRHITTSRCYMRAPKSRPKLRNICALSKPSRQDVDPRVESSCCHQLNSEFLASDSHLQNNLHHLCNLWIVSGIVLRAIRHFLL